MLLVRAALTDGDAATTPPAATTTAATTTTTGRARDDRDDDGTAGAEFYKIQAGDTLAVVAEQYGTTVEQLMVLNPDVDPVALTIGQRIRVK